MKRAPHHCLSRIPVTSISPTKLLAYPYGEAEEINVTAACLLLRTQHVIKATVESACLGCTDAVRQKACPSQVQNIVTVATYQTHVHVEQHKLFWSSTSSPCCFLYKAGCSQSPGKRALCILLSSSVPRAQEESLTANLPVQSPRSSSTTDANFSQAQKLFKP
jgi:hypothetical protein